MRNIYSTCLERAIVGKAERALVLVGTHEVVLKEFVEEVVGIDGSLGRVGFPTRTCVLYGTRNKGHVAIVLNELHIGPSTDGLYLCILLAHIVDIVLHCIGINTCEVEVALVDNLVIGSTVEETVFGIFGRNEVGNGGNGVAHVVGGLAKVATHFTKDDIVLNHLLDVGQDAEVEVDRVASRKVLDGTVHLGRQHIFAGSSGQAKTHQEDEEADNRFIFHCISIITCEIRQELGREQARGVCSRQSSVRYRVVYKLMVRPMLKLRLRGR